jgi:hypothetical protein
VPRCPVFGRAGGHLCGRANGQTFTRPKRLGRVRQASHPADRDPISGLCTLTYQTTKPPL